MTVYIEYVLIDNFVIDFLLLFTTFKIQKKTAKPVRLVLCSLFASAIALVFPMIEVHTVILTLIKIFSGALIVLISNSFLSAKEYYISLVIFLFLTFATGGIIIGVFSILGLEYSSKTAIIIMFIPAYIVIKCIRQVVNYVYRKKDFADKIIDAEIFYLNTTLQVKAFIDTGNELYYHGNPVIVLHKKVAFKLIKNVLPKFDVIDCTTVNGKSKMPVFNIDGLSFNADGSKKEFKNVCVGISKSGIGGYDLILHPAFLGEKYDENIDKMVKEVTN